MCGRYAITLPPDAMRDLFGYPEQPNFPPRYNVAPTQPVPIIRKEQDGQRHFQLVRWGLVPDWAKEVGTRPLFNARGETVAEKPAFRSAFRRRRCLIPHQQILVSSSPSSPAPRSSINRYYRQSYCRFRDV